MSKPNPVSYSIAYILFMTGACLAHIENGSELSLWITSFGLALDATLLALSILGTHKPRITFKDIPFIQKLAGIIHIIAPLVCLLSFALRFMTQITAFHWLLALSQILWSLSIITFFFNRHTPASQTQSEK